MYSNVHYPQKLKYHTSFGKCPSEVAGKLSLKLSKIFSDSSSLADLKKNIINEKLEERYFLSKYKIQFNPIKNKLYVKLDCPEVIVKVHLVKEGGLEGYDALLMSDGQLFDATYEVLLNSQNKKRQSLPYLSIPVGYSANKKQMKKISSLIQLLKKDFRKKYLSEIILSDDKSLLLVLSSGKKPTTVFFGKNLWSEKIIKVQKVFNYMKKKQKSPSIVNLTNLKKIVVKFNHTF